MCKADFCLHDLEAMNSFKICLKLSLSFNVVHVLHRHCFKPVKKNKKSLKEITVLFNVEIKSTSTYAMQHELTRFIPC